MNSKDEILIVEDSAATTMLLKDFLKNLGYNKIHSCNNGKLAIETFKQLVEAKKEPIVLLDFVLPDMDARAIMTQLLEIFPSVKVILITATEKRDEGVKELIRQGIYQYVEKPIRFENLKKVFETLEKEKQFLERQSEQIEMQKEGLEKRKEQVQVLLKAQNQISLAKLSEESNMPQDKLLDYIKELELEKKIVVLDKKKILSCNNCGSVKIIQVFHCPSCKKSDFKISKLIEHYDCGNIAEESKFKNDVCPQCKKEIKALGVDYRVMKNHFVCNNCGEKTAEIPFNYLCLKCENKFKLEDAAWTTSLYLKAINI